VSSTKARYLLDLNALVALADPDHQHHTPIQTWLRGSGKEDWGVCPLTEAGFIRVSTNPAYRPVSRTIAQATAILADFRAAPGYSYWSMPDSWCALTAPFAARVLGHQQVTDAYLLGLAVKHKGILVTFDKGIRYLAGAEFRRNLIVLE